MNFTLCLVRPNTSGESTRRSIFATNFNHQFVGFAGSRFPGLRKGSVEANDWRFPQVVRSDFSSIQRAPHGADYFAAFRFDLKIDVVSTKCALARNLELHFLTLLPALQSAHGRVNSAELRGIVQVLVKGNAYVKCIVDAVQTSRLSDAGYPT